jgi:hypothetical protein
LRIDIVVMSLEIVAQMLNPYGDMQNIWKICLTLAKGKEKREKV